jgi:hypothetical protein
MMIPVVTVVLKEFFVFIVKKPTASASFELKNPRRRLMDTAIPTTTSKRAIIASTIVVLSCNRPLSRSQR